MSLFPCFTMTLTCIVTSKPQVFFHKPIPCAKEVCATPNALDVYKLQLKCLPFQISKNLGLTSSQALP